MINQEIKGRASDKIFAVFTSALRMSQEKNRYWSICKDRAKELEATRQKDLEVYSYIFSLIEKDRK